MTSRSSAAFLPRRSRASEATVRQRRSRKGAAFSCPYSIATRGATAYADHVQRSKQPAAVILAKPWHWNESAVGWYLSEKFDGIRAKWTGKALISREGLTLNPPVWFRSQLPRGIALDGELWLDRAHDWRDVSAICGPQRDTGEAWRAVTFCVFDLPDEPGNFGKRLNALRACRDSANVRHVEHTLCASAAHFAAYYSAIVENGGEGVCLRAPGGFYRTGRSNDLRKAKPFAAAVAAA